MPRIPLALALLIAVGVSAAAAQDAPSRTVTLDVGGAYGFGVGVGYERLTGPHLALRGSVGWLGRLDLFGADLSPGPVSGVGWAEGRSRGRWLKGEAAAGLQVVPSALGSPDSAYRLAAPVGYVGVRLTYRTDPPEPLDPDPPGLVLRFGRVVQVPSMSRCRRSGRRSPTASLCFLA